MVDEGRGHLRFCDKCGGEIMDPRDEKQMRRLMITAMLADLGAITNVSVCRCDEAKEPLTLSGR